MKRVISYGKHDDSNYNEWQNKVAKERLERHQRIASIAQSLKNLADTDNLGTHDVTILHLLQQAENFTRRKD